MFLSCAQRFKTVNNKRLQKYTQRKQHQQQEEHNKQTAIDIVNTLIKENYISSLQHAGDMGIELCKAELALKNNLNYVQDKDLNLK